MAWPLKERRGPAWKQGWTGNTLSSISAPPLPLVAIIGIVMFLLWVSSYSNYKSAMQTAMINFNLFLLLLPLVLIFVAQYGRLVVQAPNVRKHFHGGDGAWGVAVAVAALVLLLLVLLSYHGDGAWRVAALVVLLLVLVSYQLNWRSQ